MNITDPQRPLITFAVVAYRQEGYIREAVEAALAQTYTPLEIILSDDGSPDRTFDIMREMTAEYRGPHEVVLNRNEPNRGLAGHLNRVAELAHGELTVAAAGDDVSQPQRVERLVAKWESAGRPVCVMYSDVMEVDKVRKPLYRTCADESSKSCLRDVLHGRKSPIIGCSEAWHPDIFEFFGPLPTNVVNEDGAIWFRAELLGRIAHVPEVLVEHRLHDENAGRGGYSDQLDGGQWLRMTEKAMHRQAAVVEGNLADLATFRERGGKRDDLDEIERWLSRWRIYARAGEKICADKGLGRFKHVPAYLKAALTIEHWKLLPKMLWPHTFRRVRSLLRPAFAS